MQLSSKLVLRAGSFVTNAPNGRTKLPNRTTNGSAKLDGVKRS